MFFRNEIEDFLCVLDQLMCPKGVSLARRVVMDVVLSRQKGWMVSALVRYKIIRGFPLVLPVARISLARDPPSLTTSEVDRAA